MFGIAVDSSGQLYVVGDLSNLGLEDVARWDGENWHQIGVNPISFASTHPTAVAIDNNNQLYVGGSFSMIDSVPANNIAKWNGTTWEALGSGLTETVRKIVPAGNGHLYVLANRKVIHWNGTVWTTIGETSNSGYPLGLAVHPNGHIYVGGTFDAINGVAVQKLAIWNGSTWSSPLTSIDRYINDVFINPAGQVYIGGSFSQINGINASKIAVWNGSSWAGMGNLTHLINGSYITNVQKITQINNQLLIGGDLLSTDAPQGYYEEWNIARWDGNSWQPMGLGADDTVTNIAGFTEQGVFIAGKFSVVGDIGTHKIAKWNGSAWEPVVEGNGIPGDNLLVMDSAISANGDVYVAGSFMGVGNLRSPYVAKWDKSEQAWQKLGDDLLSLASAYAIAVAPNGTVYAGRYYLPAGGNEWVYWLNDPNVQSIREIAVDANNVVYLSVTAMTNEGIRNQIWKRVNNEWQVILASSPSGVTQIIFDAENNVYIPDGVSKFDGTTWTTFPAPSMKKIAFDQQGHLYGTGGAPGSVYQWQAEQNSWVRLGNEFIGPIDNLQAGKNGSLFVTGSIILHNGSGYFGLGWWDGGQWHIEPEIIQGGITTMVVDEDNLVSIGGNFRGVGPLETADSTLFAQWQRPTQELQIHYEPFVEISQTVSLTAVMSIDLGFEYEWVVDGGTVITGSVITQTFPMTGTYPITVHASYGTEFYTKEIEIVVVEDIEALQHIYLPIVVRE